MRPTLIALLLATPLSAFADGSCTWESLAPLLDQSPALRAHLESTFRIDETGVASRIGPHIPQLAGRRVAPFRFQARSEALAAPVVFEIEIEAEWSLLDDAGQPVPLSEPARATQLRETLTGVRIRPAKPEAQVAPAQDDRPKRTEWIHERFNELNLDEHRLSSSSLKVPGRNLTGKAVFHYPENENTLLFVTIDGRTSDRNAFSESFYFDDGELFFVFRQTRQWNLDAEDPEKTVETIREQRFYFENGEIYLAKQREYDPATLEPNQFRIDIPQSPFGVSERLSIQLLARASRLSIARTADQLAEVYADGF